MRNHHLVACLAGALLASAAPAYAHHSSAALYDLGKTMQIEGRLVQFAFRSPHSVVTVAVRDKNGGVQRWVVEWRAAAELKRKGITRNFFKPGDDVVIQGHPGRFPGDNRLVMTGLYRAADKFGWGDVPGEVSQ